MIHFRKVFRFAFFTCLMLGGATGGYATSTDTSLIDDNNLPDRLENVNQLINKDVKKAIILAKELLADAEKLNDNYWIAESKLVIGKCYNYLGAHAEALDNLSGALELFQKQKDAKKTAYTLREIGNIYYYQDEYPIALNYYEDVLDCGKTLHDTSLMILGLIGKGSVYGNTNKLDSAMIIFKETYQLSKSINDKSTEVHSLYNIGDVYRYTNRTAKALDVFNTIERNYDVEKINSRILTSLYLSMTGAYIQLKNIEKAREYSKKMREALKRYPRINHEMRYYFLAFQIDTLLGNTDSAIENYISFKQVSDSINNLEFKERLANFQTLHELSAKEQEIDRLMLDNKLKDLSIRQKNIVNYGSAAIILLLTIVIIQTVRSAKRSKEKNKVLQLQREELEATNEELFRINDELHSQRKELETALIQLKSMQIKLIQSEKMASLGVLAAGVAHEINNPLNFIQGSITAIENFIKEKFEDHYNDFLPILELLNTGVVRASAIVNSLNHYSRRDDHFVEICDVHRIIDNSLLMLNNKLQNKINVEKEYCSDTYSFRCNEGRMHQAILNILSNAVQSIKDKGTIRIKTLLDNNMLKIVITDTGCGISEENINKITDPFFTTKEPGEGTGLGLAITQSIINEHGGSLEFTSAVGQGTSVLISLPLA
jgi:signal transduction histidine kinase